MVRGWKVFVLAGVVASGCVWERDLDRRLARLQLGGNARRMSSSAPARPAGVARSTLPTEPASAPATSAVTGSLQFTMRYLRHAYLGGEIEAGSLERTGSYFGGAYGVAGAEALSSRGSVSVELGAGRRWLRYELGADDVPETVLEPRVRGQLSLTPQITLGGVIGASAMPGEHGWMAGLYFGMYSTAIGP